jgi:hypothetical protein
MAMLTELAEHHNQITQWKAQLQDRAGIVFGGGADRELPPVDLKALHAKFRELTLENDFVEGALTKGRPVERKAMIDRTQLYRFCVSRGPGNYPFHDVRFSKAGVAARS